MWGSTVVGLPEPQVDAHRVGELDEPACFSRRRGRLADPTTGCRDGVGRRVEVVDLDIDPGSDDGRVGALLGHRPR
jgi:hypothetical protein